MKQDTAAPPNGITEARLNHSLAVARKMRNMVMLRADVFKCTPSAAFTLGMLHDIGYEFVEKQCDHAHKGGLLLKEQGYVYWREVYYHGLLQDEYASIILDLLNYADMTTGPSGEDVTMQQRIDDIALRYGENSVQTREAVKLALFLKERLVIQDLI